MKTTNYIIIALLSSLAYYFGYQEDAVAFQILTWVMLVASFILTILGYISLSRINFNTDLQKIKDSFPSKFQIFISSLFLILNSWIFYGNQVFYFYIFSCILSYIFLYKTHNKLKEYKQLKSNI